LQQNSFQNKPKYNHIFPPQNQIFSQFKWTFDKM
jgi:hypothetical protein